MREMIMAALLGAGVSSGGTYALMPHAQPADSGQALVAQMERLNTSVLQLQATQLAAYKAQAEDTNRLLILGRLQVQAITGHDPLPILQHADAARVGGAR